MWGSASCDHDRSPLVALAADAKANLVVCFISVCSSPSTSAAALTIFMWQLRGDDLAFCLPEAT